VNFGENPDGEKKREKYLTAKYGAHQMALIRKRLKVEMWMFDQLQEFCESQTETSTDVDIDLDEVLDIEDDIQRKIFVRQMLTDSRSSKEIINKFVDELLEKAKTL
jgi:protein phosphatase 1 regulatory subunit 14B